MGCFSFGDHDKERIASNHAIHFLYGHVQFAGDDTLHLFRLVPMLVANLSVFFMIACNLQVGRIFMGIRISVLQRSENVRVDKGRVENMKKRSPVRLVVNGPGFTINLSTIYSQWELLCSIGPLELCDRACGVVAGFTVGNYRTTYKIQMPGGFCRVFGRRPVRFACKIIETILFVFTNDSGFLKFPQQSQLACRR